MLLFLLEVMILETAEIARKFARESLLLTEEALNLILSSENVETAVEKVIQGLKDKHGALVMVGAEIVKEILQPEVKPLLEPSKPVEEAKPEPEPIVGELTHKKFRPISAEYEHKVKVLKDVTGKSLGKGTIEDFHRIFTSRFEKLSKILRERPRFERALSISSLRSFNGEKVAVIGMVKDKKVLKGGTIAIEIEDPTGSVMVFVSRNRQVLEKAEKVVPDEVIGVEGRVNFDYNKLRIFADDIEWPGVPVKREVRKAEIPVSVAMLSDLHVGSDKFLENVFMKFVRWLKEGGETEKEREIAGNVKYIIIAGDLVDGIGVYPEQYDELLVPDVFKQYAVAAKILSELPEHILLIISPGNHDAVRSAEPQPAIQKDVCPELYNDLKAVMVGNPALVSIEGVHFQIYHGRSFDDIVCSVPGLRREEPTGLMELMLEKRHLAPIYGGKVMFAPEREDLLVIDEIPDVFHTGHLHIFGKKKYKEVFLVNSGTFQERTEYMKKLGVTPTPGIVPILNLMSHQLDVVKFI